MARVGRIFPVFLVVFPFAVAIQPLPNGWDHMPWIAAGSLARSIWSDHWPTTWAPEIASHLTMAHGLFPDGILPDAWVSFLGAAWSLSTEWQFYLLMAAAASLAKRRAVMPDLAWLFLALSAAAFVWSACAPNGWYFSRAFLPNKAQYFALGITAAAVSLPSLERREARESLTRALVSRYAVVLCCTLALATLHGGVSKIFAPLVWTVCLAAELAPDSRLLHPLVLLLRSPALQWLGAVSYCIYLVNEPVQKLFGVTLAAVSAGNTFVFTPLWLPGAILLPLGVAAILHHTVEVPGHAWGRAVSRGMLPRQVAID